MLKALLASLAAVAVLAGTACTSGGAGTSEESISEETPMKISFTMRGEREITVTERTVNTKFIRRAEGDGVVALFGVQPVEPVVEADIAVTPGFAIKPYKGDGRYTIEPGTPREDLENSQKKGSSGASSSVRVEWWPVGGEPYEYVRRAKPCTVQVENDGTKGRLQCPDLTHEAPGGPHFSLDFRWEKA